jgi:hypothetical protein
LAIVAMLLVPSEMHDMRKRGQKVVVPFIVLYFKSWNYFVIIV